MTTLTIFVSSNIALLFFLAVAIILIGVSLNPKNENDDIEVIEYEDYEFEESDKSNLKTDDKS